jgi:hypothetical protein
MQTITTARAETRTIPIAAPPASVLAVIGDARRLPEWAPAFARAVEPAGDHWRIDTGAGQVLVDVEVIAAAGTVDIVRPGDTTTGARLRALASGGGTELLFTILFPRGVDDAAVAAQMATVEDELATVRSLAEGAPAR